MKNLTKIKWTDSKMEMHEMHLINEMSPYWEKASNLLDLEQNTTWQIDRKNHTVEDCCREVMVQWLSGADGKYMYPKSWIGLCDLLEDLELSHLAKHLRGESKPFYPLFLCLQHM